MCGRVDNFWYFLVAACFVVACCWVSAIRAILLARITGEHPDGGRVSFEIGSDGSDA